MSTDNPESLTLLSLLDILDGENSISELQHFLENNDKSLHIDDFQGSY